MSDINQILKRGSFSIDEMEFLLGTHDPAMREVIRVAAEQMLLEQCGNHVHYRGLVEFSNACARDCLYCGIRVGNPDVHRYHMTKEQILEAARFAADSGYGSLALQSGEKSSPEFIDFVEDALCAIRETTRSDALPNGLGVTLCVGEHPREVYQRFFDAGAHRYLLRIETTNADLFARIHPPEQQLKARLDCLQDLQDLGYQVGTGVMIGLPGQTRRMLAEDIAFFRSFGIDMIGMGPYIPHASSPMREWESLDLQEAFDLSLMMIAVARLALRDVNIAATTALQAIDKVGREKGLQHGANIVMPTLTPQEFREDYILYDGKPCTDENRTQCRGCLAARILSAGRIVGLNEWGDSPHFFRRRS
jgi:biotin synthase